MENNKLKGWVRVILILCSAALVGVLFVPMWRIELSAPQYPEGLTMFIYPNKLGGNIDIINGLNHYIGMKTLHANDFMEFTILPYIISFYALAFLLAGIIGRKKILYVLFVLFISFAVLSMVDFWRWEYNYGHNLDPHAAIILPGMTYQPPLIGFKQLLNFGAYSVPDIGGWIFVGVGVLVLFCAVITFRMDRNKSRLQKLAGSIFGTFMLINIASCNVGPEPIKIGIDNCVFCKMTISDVRFGAEIVTKKGKVFKFDDVYCVLSFLQENNFDRTQVKEIYLTDFSNGHSLIKAGEAFLLKCEALRSPMGGDITAFSNADSLKSVMNEYNGPVLHWNELYKP
jgi:copper chaperone NosL